MAHRTNPLPTTSAAAQLEDLFRSHRGGGVDAPDLRRARRPHPRAPCAPGATRCAARCSTGCPSISRGARVLDAGCGTGALAVEAARRGADVVAIDISPTLVDLARERTPGMAAAGSHRLPRRRHARPALGGFDHVVAMDSLIHYARGRYRPRAGRLWPRARARLDGLHLRAAHAALLTAMQAVGRALPARRPRPGDRAGRPSTICARLIAGTSGLSLAAQPHAARRQRLLHLAGHGARARS